MDQGWWTITRHMTLVRYRFLLQPLVLILTYLQPLETSRIKLSTLNSKHFNLCRWVGNFPNLSQLFKRKKSDSAHPVSSVFTTKYEDCKPMRIDRNKQILNTAAHNCRPLQQANAKYYNKKILDTASATHKCQILQQANSEHCSNQMLNTTTSKYSAAM